MTIKLIIKAILDGFIGSVLLDCLGALLVSEYALNISIKQSILLGFFAAILYALIFVIVTLKESSNKVIVSYFLISVVGFILCSVVLFVLRLLFSFNYFPVREVNNVDGILVLLANCCFIFASLVIRGCIFTVLSIKNKKAKTKEQSGDVSKPLKK